MSLERTVLDENSIKNVLKHYYGINVSNIKKTSLGTANCYIVSEGMNKFFLKEFQSDFRSEDLLREAEIVEYLANNGIPTAKYIKTISNKFFVEYSEHLICLEEYIDGSTYGYNDFPAKLMAESAQMLGRIHSTLSDYNLPIDMGKEWIDAFSIENEQRKYIEFLEILEQRKSDNYYEIIKKDLVYKQQLLANGREYIEFFNDITYKATHGDYQGCQLICDDEHIKAVVDFSSARVLPVVWEIMRSYVQTSIYSRKNARVDVYELCRYVKEYMKYSELTKNDLQAMPYVYLFQLARSKYGYPQYLLTNSEDREGLLRFALWRTDICREVEKKAEIIGRKLIELKENEK